MYDYSYINRITANGQNRYGNNINMKDVTRRKLTRSKQCLHAGDNLFLIMSHRIFFERI